MPSGLRVSRIDKVPGQGPLLLLVNGVAVGSLRNRNLFELTVGSGDILLEVIVGRIPLYALLEAAEGCTARVQLGRRRNLGLAEASHYLQVEPMVVGLPDRTRFPLNLGALSALEWLTSVQLTYLKSRLMAAEEAPPCLADVPSLRELGAFAALGLDTDAEEADVREAFRLLISIHTPETGGPNETMQRLEEAFRIAMAVLTRRQLRRGVPELGR